MWGRLFAVFHRGAAAATVKAELGGVVESQYRFITRLFVEFTVLIFTVEKRVVKLRARFAHPEAAQQEEQNEQPRLQNTASPCVF